MLNRLEFGGELLTYHNLFLLRIVCYATMLFVIVFLAVFCLAFSGICLI